MRGWVGATRFTACLPATLLPRKRNARPRLSFKCLFPFLHMMWQKFGGSGKFVFPRESNGCRKETRLRFHRKQSRQHRPLQKHSLAAKDSYPRGTSSTESGTLHRELGRVDIGSAIVFSQP
eukprot:scaffold1354_cov366-Pavlova_lutheri.AAC.6